MGLVNRIADWIVAKGLPASTAYSPWLWSTIVGSVTPRDRLAVFRQTYSISERYGFQMFSAVIRSALDKLAGACNEAALRIGRENEDGDFIPAPDSDVFRLLQSDSDYSQADFVALAVQSLQLTGGFYLLKLRSGARVEKVVYIPSDRVTPLVSKTAQALIQGYMVDQKPYPAEDVVAVRYPDPQNPAANLSPLQSCLRDVQLDDSRTELWGDVLRNMPMPGVSLTTPNRLERGQIDQLRQQMQERAGQGKRGAPVVLEGGMTLTAQNVMDDMKWVDFIVTTEARICAAMGVPAQLVGCRAGLQFSTYANFKEARKAFFITSVIPMLRRLGHGLTKGLLLDEGEMLQEIRFDYSDVTELNDETDALTTRVLSMLSAGVIGKDEARAALGYEPVNEEEEEVVA